MYSYLALAGAASALVAPSTTRPRTALQAQTAEFAQPLWGRDNFDDVDESSDTVKCTVYNIGGELTQVYSGTTLGTNGAVITYSTPVDSAGLLEICKRACVDG